MAEPDKPDATVPRTNFVDGFLRSPLSGIVPWIVMAIMSGAGPFRAGCGRRVGPHPHRHVGGQPPRHQSAFPRSLRRGRLRRVRRPRCLGVPPRHSSTGWSCGPGEITNGLLALYALATLAIRRPFTIAYARDTVDREHWGSPLFIRVNYILSAVWAGAFLINTAVGTFGDAVLHDGDNFWTGWIVQLAVTLIAVAITEFYPPDYARAKFLAATGESAEAPPPSFGKLLDWLPGFVIGIGIAGWVSDSFPAPVGIALIVVGVLAGAVMRKLFPPEKDLDQPSSAS